MSFAQYASGLWNFYRGRARSPMNILGPVLILGAITGLVYALSGAGLVVIYRSSRVINFAHGDVAAIGLYAAYALSQAGFPYWLVAVCTLFVSTVAGLTVGGFLSLRIASKWSVVEVGMATIAVSFIIEGVETQLTNGATLAFPVLSNSTVLNFWQVGITVTDVVTIIVSLIAFGCLGIWFRFSKIGMAMRAVSENPEAARWFGVPARRLRLISWGLAGALAGLAGLFIAPLYALSPTSLGTVVLFGFAAVVTGGFESITGALIAGLALGIITNLTAAYVSVLLITPVMFLVMLLTLLVRPNGILGHRPVVRV